MNYDPKNHVRPSDESIQSLSSQKEYCQSYALVALGLILGNTSSNIQKWHHALLLRNLHSANIVLSFAESLPYQAPCFPNQIS